MKPSTPAPRAARLEMVTVLARDVDASVAFYRDALGFELRARRGAYAEFATTGPRFVVYSSADMAALTGGEARAGGASLALRCDDPADVNASYARAVARGAAPLRAPARVPWGQYAGFVADPDGNVVEYFADAVG